MMSKHVIRAAAGIALGIGLFLTPGMSWAKPDWNPVPRPPTQADFAEVPANPRVRAARLLAEAEGELGNKDLRALAQTQMSVCSEDPNSLRCHEAAQQAVAALRGSLSAAKRKLSGVLEIEDSDAGAREAKKHAEEVERMAARVAKDMTEAKNRAGWAAWGAFLDHRTPSRRNAATLDIYRHAQATIDSIRRPGGVADALAEFRERAKARLTQVLVLDLQAQTVEELNVLAAMDQILGGIAESEIPEAVPVQGLEPAQTEEPTLSSDDLYLE